MTEEEKKAIEYLKLMKKEIDFNKQGIVYGKETIDTILNLIEKLQKEKDEILNSKVGVDLSFDDYISKDKIREKIGELQKYKKEIEDEKDEEYFKVLSQIRLLRKLLKEE